MVLRMAEPKPHLNSLLSFDPRVRCVVALGLDGKLRTSASREGLESLEPEDETTRILYQTAIGNGMGSLANRYHGRVRAVIVVRERLSLIVFPVFEELVLISVDPEFPLEKTRELAELLDLV